MGPKLSHHPWHGSIFSDFLKLEGTTRGVVHGKSQLVATFVLHGSIFAVFLIAFFASHFLWSELATPPPPSPSRCSRKP